MNTNLLAAILAQQGAPVNTVALEWLCIVILFLCALGWVITSAVKAGMKDRDKR